MARFGLHPGVGAALGAVLLFGAGTPLAKLLLVDTGPWLLAGCCTWARVWARARGVCSGAARAWHLAMLWQNSALALGIKAVFLAMAVFGQASMWMAVFADVGASLLVIFNGLRLVRPAASSGTSHGAVHRAVEVQSATARGL